MQNTHCSQQFAPIPQRSHFRAFTVTLSLVYFRRFSDRNNCILSILFRTVIFTMDLKIPGAMSYNALRSKKTDISLAINLT